LGGVVALDVAAVLAVVLAVVLVLLVPLATLLVFVASIMEVPVEAMST
jgi:hypothetical protein